MARLHARAALLLALAVAAAPAAQGTGGTDLTPLLRDSPQLGEVASNMAANLCEGVTPFSVAGAGASAYLLAPGASLGSLEGALAKIGLGTGRAAQIGEAAAGVLKGGGKGIGLLALAGASYLFVFTEPEERQAGCTAQLGRIIGYPAEALGAATVPPTDTAPATPMPTHQGKIGSDSLAILLEGWASAAAP